MRLEHLGKGEPGLVRLSIVKLAYTLDFLIVGSLDRRFWRVVEVINFGNDIEPGRPL